MGSIPTRSRHTTTGNATGGYWPLASVIACTLAVTLAFAPAPALAQQQDSTRAGIGRESPPPAADAPAPRVAVQASVAPPRAHPQISAKTAFLSSLLLPGLGQARLDRSYAGALFFSAEAASFEMLRQAEIDLHYAQAHVHDSTRVVQTYQVDSLGQVVRDSTGKPVPLTYGYARYDSTRVAARKTHVEDWIAALVFNHLISAADAFVAAQLWDLPAHVHPMTGMSSDGKRQLYGLSVNF